MTSPATPQQPRDLYAELHRAWGKTNLGDQESVQIFLMCFDAIWSQIQAQRSETGEYICKCGLRVVPHRCQTGQEF